MRRGFKFFMFALMAALIAAGSAFAAADAEKAASLKASVKAAEAAVKAQDKSAKEKGKFIAKADPKECFGCHDNSNTKVQMLYERGNHKGVNCVSCHNIPADHAENADHKTVKTRMDWQACGACHKEQMDSFLQIDIKNRPARFEKSNATGRSPNPAWDKLMYGHGFTNEHSATRSHAFMLIDQFVVDRAFGGRFQGIDGWNYIFEPGDVWTVLKNREPETNMQKKFPKMQSATANNPVCMNCKTMDHMLGWAYMGDPVPGTDWSRKSNPVEMAQNMHYGLNCFFCHDPHSAEPRIVRDALIETITSTDPIYKDNLYNKDTTKVYAPEVLTMGIRGFDRKIAILKKDDPKRGILQCAQCHVEYNCNPGTNPEDGSKITMESRLTNHFPFKDVLDLYDHYYKTVKFFDFPNGLSKSPLWKGQHPESETYYNSVHAKADIACAQCHVTAVKDNKGSLQYTSHFVASPRHQLKATCITSDCHGQGATAETWNKKYTRNNGKDYTKKDARYFKASTGWTEEQALYSINSIKAYFTGKLRKAEFHLSQLIDAIVAAQRMGISEDIIKQAQDKHAQAHILWEYWTAENSDGFHNTDLARESIAKSIATSMEGYKIVNDAMLAKAKPAPKAEAEPAPAPAKKKTTKKM